MVYVTTSRKPSLTTRRLAKELARALRAESENRGKRSVQEILERAEAKGHSRCLLIYEDNGNPSKLCFLEKGKWLPCLLLKGISFAEAEEKQGKKRRLPGVSKTIAEDAEGREMAGLFEECVNEEIGEGVEIKANKNEISFWLARERVGPVLKIKGVEE